MARLFAILGALMSTHIASTHAGACLSICQQNSDDPTPCPPARPIPMPQNPLSSVCRNRLPEGEKWACEDEAIVFPTVECILADMKTCNNIGQNTVFYSFGVRANDVRINVRDKLSPKGVMFFDALDVTWWNAMSMRFPIFSYSHNLRNIQPVFAARYSQAMSEGSSGIAYLAVKHHYGLGGGEGAYQLPLTPGPPANIWRSYEFPAIQHKSAVTLLLSAAEDENWLPREAWRKGDGQEELEFLDTNDIPNPMRRRRRGLQVRDYTCRVPFDPYVHMKTPGP